MEYDGTKILKALEARADFYRKKPTFLRLGQHLMNTLEPSEINPKIFYEEDPEKAFSAFLDDYCRAP